MAAGVLRPRPGRRAAPLAGWLPAGVGLFGLLWLAGRAGEVVPSSPFWLATAACAVMAAAGIGRLAGLSRRTALPAGLTLALVLLVVEVLIRGFRVPVGLIPAPSQVFVTAWTAHEVLLRDTQYTFVLEALVGYGLGVALGLVAALLISRFSFLERGVLPYATALSSIPIVGFAPVMVAALGSGWESKAAVVTVTIFFPVVANAIRGLAEVDPLALDLMRSYGASEREVFTRLRIPNALPFVFNALKIAATLSLIGAIVGEFFGSPGLGLGFRIKIEAGRFGFDVVWAAILYASVLGIAFYTLVAAFERRFTAWHVSLRGEEV